MSLRSTGNRWIRLLICFCISILIIISLFIFSYRVNHRPNGFIRLFPPHLLSAKYVTDLGFNSFYIAGVSQSSVFLGNYTTPSFLYELNHQLTDTHKLKLTIPFNVKFPAASTVLMVDSPYIYLSSYTKSLVLSGSFPSLVLHVLEDSLRFIASIAVQAGTIIFQVENEFHDQNLLVRKKYTFPVQSDTSSILDRNHEGILQTDGTAIFNKSTGRLFYVYSYFNQFVCFDTNLNRIYRGKTIDTINSPHIKLSNLNAHVIVMGAPPLRVNLNSCVSDRWLFVHSGLKANNEDLEAFDQSSVVDVYNQSNGKYAFSLRLSENKGEKLKSMFAFNKELVVIYNHEIFIYRLNF